MQKDIRVMAGGQPHQLPLIISICHHLKAGPFNRPAIPSRISLVLWASRTRISFWAGLLLSIITFSSPLL
jgi:hypothetical protein